MVERLCLPVRIDWPGVRVGEAARLLGVNVKTVWEWTKGEVEEDGSLRREWGKRLVRDEYVNRADRKRNAVRVWSRGGVMAGEVWAGPWGDQVAEAMVGRVRASFSQRLIRERHELTERCGQWRWVCPECGGRVLRMVWAMEPWTVLSAKGVRGLGVWRGGEEEGFRCVRCAGVVYESSERRWRKGEEGERVFWERWVRRMIGGQGRR
ncbi:MAG: hypothetical protein IT442_01450 [Phycisphaeraceae bacterium]|nr:hypothetical protein [Phycisphaeraceae bacterium]